MIKPLLVAVAGYLQPINPLSNAADGYLSTDMPPSPKNKFQGGGLYHKMLNDKRKKRNNAIIMAMMK